MKPPLNGLEDILANIPLAQALQTQIAEYENGRLVLAAPSEPSLNHIGIAFGGAIECLATLTGWGLLWLTLAEPDWRIVIQHAETTFRVPLRGDLKAEAKLPESDEWTQFRSRLECRGWARIDVEVRVGNTLESEGALFRGRYAVRTRDAG